MVVTTPAGVTFRIVRLPVQLQVAGIVELGHASRAIAAPGSACGSCQRGDDATRSNLTDRMISRIGHVNQTTRVDGDPVRRVESRRGSCAIRRAWIFR